ncbi:hypothetical protein Tco_0086866 [Tanacetum coccineum]
MSDSEDSTVTYTTVSSPFEGLSYTGSPGVDGPPVMPEDPYAYVVASFQAPPSSDYMPGPEEPEQAPLSLEFVPEPVYLEFMPPEDEVFPTEEQPLPAAVSPTAASPGYIIDSHPDEDKEDPEEVPKEDPIDYHVDELDDDDDDDEPSGDEADDEDDKEEEEHPAPAVSVPPPPVHRTTARISIPAQAPVPFLSKEEVERFLAISTPPPSPLTPLLSPLPQIPSPPLPASPPLPVSSPPLPANPTHPLGYRAAMIWLRAETPSTSHPLPSSTLPSGLPLLPIPLPTSSPPLLLPSIDYRVGVSEVILRLRKRFCIALGLRYETEIAGLRVADRTRQAQFVETLTLLRTLQIKVTKLQSQQGPAGSPVQPEILEEAGFIIFSLCDKMAPKRTTRSTPAATATTTTTVTDAQLKELIDQGVANALAARDADRSLNGEDSHDSGTGVRRQALPARECTYPDIMKCKPLYFKGTK